MLLNGLRHVSTLGRSRAAARSCFWVAIIVTVATLTPLVTIEKVFVMWQGYHVIELISYDVLNAHRMAD